MIDDKFLKMASILNSFELKGIWSNERYPMVSLPFLDWFNSYDFSDWKMIEFGAGDSTNYFAERTKNYISLETSIEFYESICNKFDDTNIDLRLVELDDLENGNYDIDVDQKTIVFIDSEGNRLKESKSLIKKGTPNIIFVDNSEWFPNQCKYIYESGYSEFPFWGIRFEGHIDKCTSVFVKNGFKMPPKKYDYFPPGSYPGYKTENDID